MGRAIAFFAIMLGITVGALYGIQAMRPHVVVKREGVGSAVVKTTSFGTGKTDWNTTNVRLQDGREIQVDGHVIVKPGAPLQIQTFSDGSIKLCFAPGARQPLCKNAWQEPF